MEAAIGMYVELKKQQERDAQIAAHEKRIYAEIKNQNTSYFEREDWWGACDLDTIFGYAVRENSPLTIIAPIIRAKITQHGFTRTFRLLLSHKVSTECLEILLKYKKPEINLVTKRFRPRKKSVLHKCAKADHLPWLRYFIENLGFDQHRECWFDSRGNGVLYYAAKADALDVVLYLVDVRHQSPLEKGTKRNSKSPMQVAKKNVKAYFQNGNAQHYAAGALQQNGFYLPAPPDTSPNNTNNTAVVQKPADEKTPLITTSAKK